MIELFVELIIKISERLLCDNNLTLEQQLLLEEVKEELDNFQDKAIQLAPYQQQPITSWSKQKIVIVVAPNMDDYAQHLVMSMSIILFVIFI